MLRAAYYAMCDFIDVQVGRMLESLRKTGQLENTIVIFHSDHGESLGDHGVYLKGPYFYESGIRVPLIISRPDSFLEGVTCEALVELLDIAPTLLEACGLPPAPGMQGYSMLRLLTGEAPSTISATAYFPKSTPIRRTPNRIHTVPWCLTAGTNRQRFTPSPHATAKAPFTGNCTT